MLVFHRDAKVIIEQVNNGPTEFLPLSIYNYRKKLLSSDYFIVNPLGSYMCLDRKKSEFHLERGVFCGIKTMILDPKRLDKVPDLFRPRKDPSNYIASKKLLDALFKGGELKPTNIVARKIKIG